MVGALRDGKVPAESHTFSPFCNFQVWDVGIKPGAGTKKGCEFAAAGLLAGELPASAWRPGPSGERTGGRAGGPGPPRPRLGSAPWSQVSLCSLVVRGR